MISVEKYIILRGLDYAVMCTDKRKLRAFEFNKIR